MAYESPISIVERITRSATEEMEDTIVRTVSLHCGVTVNKEELKKALDYDRQQYDKGYKDALAKVKDIIDFYEINIDSTQGPRPINNTSRHHVYEAICEIEQLVRR